VLRGQSIQYCHDMLAIEALSSASRYPLASTLEIESHQHLIGHEVEIRTSFAARGRIPSRRYIWQTIFDIRSQKGASHTWPPLIILVF